MNKKVKEIINFCEEVVDSGRDFTELHAVSKGHSERVIETPWVASILSKYPNSDLLDIGFTMASLDYLGLLFMLNDKLGINIDALDIVKPERVMGRYPEEWQERVKQQNITIADVREYRCTKQYDFITCISTIEHVGFDSATYDDPETAFARCKNSKDVKMLREESVDENVLDTFSSLLRPGGHALISVPVGKGGPVLLKDSLGFYCAQWEYDSESFNRMISHSDFSVAQERFFQECDGLWEEVPSLSHINNRTGELKEHAEACALLLLVKK